MDCSVDTYQWINVRWILSYSICLYGTQPYFIYTKHASLTTNHRHELLRNMDYPINRFIIDHYRDVCSMLILSYDMGNVSSMILQDTGISEQYSPPIIHWFNYTHLLNYKITVQVSVWNLSDIYLPDSY